MNLHVNVYGVKETYKREYSAKDTHHFIDPTDRSHPISDPCIVCRIS